jgi:demethylmenaquinone methyltransferase/2-methoxy-6-polyprenyl-1,4-benzoquinol methylase
MENSPTTDPRVAFFDRLAATWDQSGPPVEQQVQRLQSLQDQLGLQPGARILEIGCGTGLITGWLLRQVSPGSVTAIDFSPAMLDHARARNHDANCLAWDICSAPIPSADFDVAFCLHVVPHFRDLDAAFRNIAASLRAKGALVILHLSGRDHVNGVHQRIGGEVAHDLLPEAAELHHRLEQAGFHVEEVIDTPELFLIRARKGVRGSGSR